MAEAAAARAALAEWGATEVPSWHHALAGAEAPQPKLRDDDNGGDDVYNHGWQNYACSFCETFFAEQVVKPICDEPRQAMLLSQGGSGSAWLRAIPSEPTHCMSPARFQVAMRRRLRWP